jgi:urease accessory protein
LLRLASPALPVGAFAWSGGLEAAIEAGLVRDPDTARRWLEDLFTLGLGRWDLPLLARMFAALDRGDLAAARALDARFIAARETAELRAETLQVGGSLLALHRDTGGAIPAGLTPPVGLPLAFAVAAHGLGLRVDEALLGFAYAALEGQLAVLAKAVPLGQIAVQRLLVALTAEGGALDRAIAIARALPDAALSSSLPGLAILSAAHETQYSRLFRS